MSNLLSQVSFPVFLDCVFVFFVIGSIFSFIVGVALALRNETMLRFFDFMNQWVSIRKLSKPLAIPRIIEPVLLKHRHFLGGGLILGATVSIYLLSGIDSALFQPIFLGLFSYFTAKILADYLELFLLAGNGVCLAVGLMVLFFPRQLLSIEAYTDRWYSLRKQTLPLSRMHFGVDKWVLAHPTVSGVALSLMSLVLGVSMYARI